MTVALHVQPADAPAGF